MKICRKKLHTYNDSEKTCPECKRLRMQQWQKDNVEHRREYNQEYVKRNYSKLKENWKAYSASNSEKKREVAKQWRHDNPEQARENRRRLERKYRESRPLFKLIKSLRCRTKQAIKGRGFKKSQAMTNILGCDWAVLQDHLIMTAIKNYGSWDEGNEYHIDHIIPLASARTEEELIALCHYTNLQLLTPPDNLRKGAKLQQ